MKSTIRAAIFASALAVSMSIPMALVTGCGKDESQRDARTDAQRRQADAQAIQNNPHIPPATKAAILQRQQQSQAARRPVK